MKIKLLKTISVICLFVCIQCCSQEKLPNSINIKNNFITINFKDYAYQKVFFGTDLYGKWLNLPMHKHDSVWVIKFKNPHKGIQYKFFIDGIFWERDSTNPQKEKVPAPFVGDNSYFKFK